MIASKQIAFGKAAGKRKPYDAEIKFLDSTGTQYIDTGVIPDTQDVRVEITYANGTGYLFGSRNSSSFSADNHLWSAYAIRPSVCRADWVGVTTNISVTESAKTIVFSSDSTGSSITYNGTTKTGSIKIPINLPLILFGVNTNGTITVATRMTLYSFKAWKNGILVFDAIPVRKGNIGYMYDRVSGQLFGNQGTGEFVLGPDIIDYTAKDYVQDGLVAMWDGIENAGWGVHDPSAAVWKDLVGDCDLPFSDYSEFTDKYLHGLSESRGRYSVRANIGQIGAIIQSGVFTFGGVMRTSSVCPNYGAGIRFINNTNLRGYANVRNGTSPFTEVRTRFQVGINGTQTNVLGAYHTNTEHQVIVVANGTTSDVYVDGVKDVSSVISDEIINSLFLDGASDYGDLLVYNRALTAEEIAHNYSIDKARFGL